MSRRFVTVFEFQGEAEDELTLKPGDVIDVAHGTRDVGHGWMEGTALKDGKVGVFPLDFVKEEKIQATAPSKIRRFITQFEFIAEADDELSLTPGDLVDVADEIDDLGEEWCRGTAVKTGKVGIFPLAFVKEMAGEGLKSIFTKSNDYDEATECNLRSNPKVAEETLPPCVSDSIQTKGTIEVQKDARSESHDPVPEDGFDFRPLSQQEGKEESHHDGAKTKSKLRRYITAFEFIGEHEDELTLYPGDVVEVLGESTECNDGWREGTSVKDGKFGLFPIDFVREEEILANSENSFGHHEESPNEEKSETFKTVLESNETTLHPENELSLDACSNDTNLPLGQSSHKLTLSEASKTTQLSLQMVKIISAEHIFEPLSVQATETAIRQADTIAERECLLDALQSGQSPDDINSLALQARQMLSLVDNAIKSKRKDGGTVDASQMIMSLATSLTGATDPKTAQTAKVEDTKQAAMKTADTVPKHNRETDDPSSWIPDEDSENDFVGSERNLSDFFPSPSPSLSNTSTPAPSPLPEKEAVQSPKRIVHRHASIVFVVEEPATLDVIAKYKPSIFSQYVASLTGCLFISVTKAIKAALASGGQIMEDIMVHVRNQKPVPRGIVYSVLFGEITKAMKDFDENPLKYQTQPHRYGSPGKIKYYDFIISGFPCDENDILQFLAVASAIFPDGVDWRLCYVQCPNPKQREKIRLQKHQWNSLSTGRIEEAKRVRLDQIEFRKRIGSLEKSLQGKRPNNEKHVAKGSKIGGKSRVCLHKIALGSLSVKEVVRNVAVAIAGYTSTLDRKLELTPEAFHDSTHYERGTQTSMSELPASSFDASRSKTKRFNRKIIERRKAEPFVRGGSPIKMNVVIKDIRIDGKIRPRPKYPFKRAQSVTGSKHQAGSAPQLDVSGDRGNARTAPTMSLLEELWRWLRSLSLPSWNRIENVDGWRREFANGYIFADILAAYFPRAIFTHMFNPLGASSYVKRDNWALLLKFFKRHRIDLGAPERMTGSSTTYTVIPKGMKSTEYLSDAAMQASPNAAVSILKGIYFFLLQLGLVKPLQNIYIPQHIPTPTPHVINTEPSETREEAAARQLIFAMENLKVALRKNAHGKSHVDLRGFQGKKLTPSEFRRQLQTQLGLKLTDSEYKLVYTFFDKDGDGSIDYVEVMHKFLHVKRMDVAWDEAMAVARKVCNSRDNMFSSVHTLPPALPQGTPTKPHALGSQGENQSFQTNKNGILARPAVAKQGHAMRNASSGGSRGMYMPPRSQNPPRAPMLNPSRSSQVSRSGSITRSSTSNALTSQQSWYMEAQQLQQRMPQQYLQSTGIEPRQMPQPYYQSSITESPQDALFHYGGGGGPRPQYSNFPNSTNNGIMQMPQQHYQQPPPPMDPPPWHVQQSSQVYPGMYQPPAQRFLEEYA